MVTDKMIYKAWIRLADGLWKQSTIAYEARQYDLSSAWAKAAIHAAKIARVQFPKKRHWH